MADEVKETGKAVKGFSNKVKLIIVIVVVLIAVIVGLVLAMKFFKKPADNENKTTTEQTDDSGKKTTTDVPPEKVIITDLNPIKVNPAGTKGTRFLQATISVQVDSDVVLVEISEKQSIIMDKLSTILGSLSILDLDQFNVPDYEGITLKERTKKRISDSMNEILKTGKVINVYFKDFIVQ